MERRRDFRLYWLAGVTDRMGTHAAELTLVLLVLTVGGSPAMAGLLGTVAVAVPTTLGPVAGVLADRWSRRRLMLGSAAVAFAAFGVLTSAVFLDRVTLPLLFAVTAVESAAGAVYVAAARGAIRALLPPDNPSGAVAALQARDQGAALLGPLLGGVLYQLARWAPFAANALSYAGAALCVRSIRTELSAPGRPGRTKSFGDSAREGWNFLWHQPFLRFALVWGAGVNAVFTAAYYFVLIAARTHGASPASVGLMLSLASGCGLVGALVSPWVLRRVPAGRLVVGCSLAMVVLVAPLGAVRSVWAYGVLFGAALFVGPMLSVLFQTRAIALVPPELQGRTGAALESAVNAVQLVAPVTAGLLTGLLDPVAVGLLLSAVLLVLAGYAYGGRRHFDDVPPAPVPTSVSQGD
ncbi:MFS transporter [Streptomyces xylophagus]|uniref:MFS transporter n=1 Tax=Streptomyces xylophagus TaxID=285514 RepID=UPI00068CE9B3|nr:MFS transporter [Streptomyces xylophagus]